jgi:hypothetical protein
MEMAMVYFKVLSGHLFERNKENHKNFSNDSQFLGSSLFCPCFLVYLMMPCQLYRLYSVK